MADEWSPPKRNTEDPMRPPLPGMEHPAPRVKPGDRRYHQAGNAEVWGHLAHPALQEHNPFLNGVEHDQEGSSRGLLWRQEYGGRATAHEDYGYGPARSPEAEERTVRRTMANSLPAVAIARHPLMQVLQSGRMKSQFETHTSGGALDHEVRSDLEHKMFGYPHDLAPHARPIYGYLTHHPLQEHPGAGGYGEHTLILHRPRIWHRTSAFIGDSLDEQDMGHSAHPVQDFRLSGVPRDLDPRKHRLDRLDRDHGVMYTEAQYHGGVGLRDVHYAVLRQPDVWLRNHDSATMEKHQALKEALNQHRVPWVEVDRGKPVDWNKHEARLRNDILKGAIMQPKHQMRVVGQQGDGRFLIDLGYDNEHGHRQAQVADIERGELHPPMSLHSITARGYWENPKYDVSVEDVLPHVTPR